MNLPWISIQFFYSSVFLLFLLLGELFIKWFSCFGTKQIYMDGEQMGELALIIWNPSMEMKKRKSRFLIWLFLIIKLKAPCEKENKKRLVWGLHPMAMLADMAVWKQVFRIHDDNPDRTPCRPISIKSPPLRGGEQPHYVLIKSHPDVIDIRMGLQLISCPAVTMQDADGIADGFLFRSNDAGCRW